MKIHDSLKLEFLIYFLFFFYFFFFFFLSDYVWLLVFIISSFQIILHFTLIVFYRGFYFIFVRINFSLFDHDTH